MRGVDEAADVTCTWLTAPRGGDELRGKVVTQPCNERFVLDVPYPGGADVKVEIGGREIAAADVKVRDLLIVGMGDSFASGEGNPDVPVRFSRERAADYGKSPKRSDLAGLSGPRRRLEADRRQAVHRARTRAGSTRRATARSIRTSCAPRCSSPSRTRTAR